MLPRIHRLNKKEDFQRVYAHGTFFSSGIVLLNCLQSNTNKTRIGFVVSKKVSNKAVDRNAAKRLLREATRKKIHEIQSGWDVIVTLHAKAKDHSKKEIEQALEKVLRKSNLLH